MYSHVYFVLVTDLVWFHCNIFLLHACVIFCVFSDSVKSGLWWYGSFLFPLHFVEKSPLQVPVFTLSIKMLEPVMSVSHLFTLSIKMLEPVMSIRHLFTSVSHQENLKTSA
jgi:hypothetical protein